MAIKITVKELSQKIGISASEISKLLKTHGVEISSDSQELTPEDIKVIRAGMKKDGDATREKVSLSSKKSSSSSKGKLTIKRTSISNKTSRTLSLKAPVVKKAHNLNAFEPKKKEPKKPVETATPKEAATPTQPTNVAEPKPEEPKKPARQKPIAKQSKIEIGELTTLEELATKSGITMQALTQAFFDQGYMLKKNDDIDRDTASLLLEVVGVSVESSQEEAPSTPSKRKVKSSSSKQETRAPIVTIMGHVDHGKTSLIDYLRKTKVAQKESGGITQHIAAYQVPTSKGSITFLDTPGHEAFSNMRSRGAKLTDIIVLIIACNDGIKPQTIESIQHAQASETPMIVALTKMDVAEKGREEVVIKELSSHGVIAESWGGDTIICPISSKTGQGIDELLESISLQAEVMELKASNASTLEGCVIESKVDRGRGTVVTLIVQEGTLSVGDIVSIGPGYGKVRTMIDGSGQKIKKAGPSTPVEITGISPAPNAQDTIHAHKDEKSARAEAQAYITANSKQTTATMTLETLFAQQASDKLSLNYILKTDTQGSLEALTDIIESMSTDTLEINIIDSGIGSINSSDATLAINANAHILGFHISTESSAKKVLESNSLSAHNFKIIYQLIDHIKADIRKLKGPEMVEKQLGKARVKAVFRSSKFGQIAGCGVLDGIIKRGAMIRIMRDDKVVFDGELSSLKREKETITEARKGTECGLGFKNFSDAEVGDDILCYSLEEKAIDE